MTISTQNDALVNLFFYFSDRRPSGDKIGYCQIFLPRIGVVKVQGSIVREPAPRTGQGFLIVGQPSILFLPALSLPCLLASSAFVPPVSPAADRCSYAKVFLGLLGFAIFAKFHGTSSVITPRSCLYAGHSAIIARFASPCKEARDFSRPAAGCVRPRRARSPACLLIFSINKRGLKSGQNF